MINTKFIFSVLFCLLSYLLSAQVSIGRTTNTNSSVLIEFNDERFVGGQQKGLILPLITDLETNASNGTLVFHINGNNSSFKVKSGNTWEELSAVSNQSVVPNYPQSMERTIINDGTVTSTSNTGLLVLKSNQKAMVLPNINGVESFPNPQAGLLVYDTTRKSLAFFNGEVWSFIYGESL